MPYFSLFFLFGKASSRRLNSLYFFVFPVLFYISKLSLRFFILELLFFDMKDLLESIVKVSYFISASTCLVSRNCIFIL